VCQREGTIIFFDNAPGTTNKTTFLDVRSRTQGYDDCGMLGMAFHPEFRMPGSTNRGYVYVYYNYSPSPVIPAAITARLPRPRVTIDCRDLPSRMVRC
jgi:hypothetical protein